ncbi:hypothetical protein MKEN_00141700 [Mycena kentingensis (nom. inval.)]|nr:hypothetical protein MKEN_00141700 [Mycena kentingensis (nom. inval.)]
MVLGLFFAERLVTARGLTLAFDNSHFAKTSLAAGSVASVDAGSATSFNPDEDDDLAILHDQVTNLCDTIIARKSFPVLQRLTVYINLVATGTLMVPLINMVELRWRKGPSQGLERIADVEFLCWRIGMDLNPIVSLIVSLILIATLPLALSLIAVVVPFIVAAFLSIFAFVFTFVALVLALILSFVFPLVTFILPFVVLVFVLAAVILSFIVLTSFIFAIALILTVLPLFLPPTNTKFLAHRKRNKERLAAHNVDAAASDTVAALTRAHKQRETRTSASAGTYLDLNVDIKVGLSEREGCQCEDNRRGEGSETHRWRL